MNRFGDSRVQLQACVDRLEQARSLEDPAARRAHAEAVLSLVARLQRGAQLEPPLRKMIAADDLDRAVQLMSAYRDARGTTRWLLAPLVILVAIAAPAALIWPRFSAPNREALVAANSCWASIEALGASIEMHPWKLPWGTSSHEDVENFARWRLPLRGADGDGALYYVGEREAGQWRVLWASLEVDDGLLGVVPCRGAIDPADRKGELTRGYRGAGEVTAARGDAPAQLGEPCELRIDPQRDYPRDSPYNCRIVIRCGERALYGAASNVGHTHCAPRLGAPTGAVDGFASDVSGDPMLTLDVNAGTARLTDGADGRDYTVEIRFDATP